MSGARCAPGPISPQTRRLAVTAWAARLGAVTAEALAERWRLTAPAARATLNGAVRSGLLASSKPLAAAPALYTATAAGTRACGERGLAPCRVSAKEARHLIACALVAASLERRMPEYRVAGERELRREEREHGSPLASAAIGLDGGEERLHRPDLVLWLTQPGMKLEGPAGESRFPLPIAVEVELTVKPQRRLEAICRAWARCELVAGVLYVVSPEVSKPLQRAIADADAATRIEVLGLDAFGGSIAQTIPTSP